MANMPRVGFTIFVARGGQKLTLCRGIEDRGAAIAVAVAMAADRPVGLEGMVIRCESTQEQWAATDLVDELASTPKPPRGPATGT